MELYPRLIRDVPGAIAAHVVEAPFKDIGTPADYLHSSLELAMAEGDRLVSRRHVVIDPTAELDRTAVWDRVTIGAHARLEECIVCDGVEIPAGARYRRCAIVPAAAAAPRADERVEGKLLIKNF
jgi:NDP-sugar pyrophosphorylase family protein